MRLGEWAEAAACRGMDPEVFFPERGERRAGYRQAKSVCGRCPVRDDCLNYATAANERYGVWGGQGPVERRIRWD